VDGNHFSSGEGGGIQTAQIRGVYWADVARNPGWVMFRPMHFYRDKASIGDYNLVYATLQLVMLIMYLLCSQFNYAMICNIKNMFNVAVRRK